MNIINELQLIVDELKLRNYSKNTQKSYCHCLRTYFNYDKQGTQRCDVYQIKQFISSLQGNSYSSNSVSLFLNVIKFYYLAVLKTTTKINIKTPKRPKKLPITLNNAEIQRIINSITNHKHNILISLAYGAGLRVSEIINIRVSDISLDDLVLNVKGGNGNKDRISVVPCKIVSDLQRLMDEKQQYEYVFASERGGKLTSRTAQVIFERALKKAGIKKQASFYNELGFLIQNKSPDR